jgi:hypothetical protein
LHATFSGAFAQLTLPSAKAAGFSFLRGSRLMSRRLTSSPRAFEESVCPAASASEIDCACECLVFAPFSRSFVGKCFTLGPTPGNRQHSVVKDRCVGSRHAAYIIPGCERRNIVDVETSRRFILSAKAGGFLASNSVRQAVRGDGTNPLPCSGPSPIVLAGSGCRA